MGLPEVLQQAGGIVGVLGAGIAGEIYRRFRAAEKTAKVALKLARMAQDTAVNIATQVDTLRSTVHNEMTAFKNAIDDRIRRFEERYEDIIVRRNSDPPTSITGQIRTMSTEVAPMLEQLNDRIKEIREDVMGEIVRERGQRHALQRELNAYAQGDAQSWSELMRLIGQIETKIETLMSLQRVVNDLQRDFQLLRLHGKQS